ncbi:MAG: ATP synthase F1 subunit delta [Marinoscillum sp.]
MSITRIAVRYAKPLLALAEEHKSLEAVKKDMEDFAALCKTNRDFVAMLKSPIIPNLKKAEILKLIFDKKVNALTFSFLELVARKNREQYLPEIAREFVVLYNNKMGYQEATITTAVAIDDKLRKEFEKLVADVTGKKPLMTEKINPELVGGYILKLGDRQIDESISGQLKDLKLKFQKETI